MRLSLCRFQTNEWLFFIGSSLTWPLLSSATKIGWGCAVSFPKPLTYLWPKWLRNHVPCGRTYLHTRLGDMAWHNMLSPRFPFLIQTKQKLHRLRTFCFSLEKRLKLWGESCQTSQQWNEIWVGGKPILVPMAIIRRCSRITILTLRGRWGSQQSIILAASLSCICNC